MLTSVWRKPLPRWLGLVALSSIILTGSGIAFLLTAESGPLPEITTVVTVLPPGSYPTSPLPEGAMFPPFEAEGWLNGEPRPFEGGSPKLTVVDIWADWCPACRQTAPGVVEAYRKYKNSNVAFVSLTNFNREGVEAFAKQFSIPWACGYGASLESLARFGVYSTARLSTNYNPGYEVTPTIFIIGADGRVIWNDGSARPLHKMDATSVVRELDFEIGKALMADAIRN